MYKFLNDLTNIFSKTEIMRDKSGKVEHCQIWIKGRSGPFSDSAQMWTPPKCHTD